MNDIIQRLQKELDKVRSQLYIFYELNKAMRTTLRLDEITYIILTGITAHAGLGFNRAVLLFLDNDKKNVQGFMGIGPMNSKESGAIWHSIEKDKKNLYDLIDNYNFIKTSKNMAYLFIEFIRSLTFEYCSENKILFDSLQTNNTFHFKKLSSSEFQNDPLIQKLNLEEFLICSLWIKNQAKGIIIVDNCVTKKPIEPDDIKIFNMFIEQASGAIENSQSFESTLTKAHTDSLTSLWNYGYFQYKLDEELIKANSIKLPLSVMMIDVDDFKKFNDAYGHIQGDNALKKLSAIIKENCRKIDILCRYGGEEFSLILPNNNKQDANLLGERIRKSIEQKEIISYNFTVSIGISSYPEDGLNKLTIINQADKSLYQAKRNGKNQVVLT